MGVEQLAIPESASVPVKVTVTLVLFQPLAFGPGEAAACVVGGVLSIWTEGEAKLAVFPATSVTVTLPLTEVPSVVNNRGLGTDVEATPDKLSAGMKPKLTLVLFHPAVLAGGAATA